MKIYTKTGDKGQTSLLGGTRVSKGHQKIEAYGTVDELNAIIGMLRSSTAYASDILLQIQHHLFNMGSALAQERKLSYEIPQLTRDDIQNLESEIDRMNETLPPLKNFILPGGGTSSSLAHLARTVCRRAERRVVVLDEDYAVIIQYLNRLSDYFFVLSRSLVQEEGEDEVKWKK